MLDAYDVDYTLEKMAIDRLNERSSRVKKFLASAKSKKRKKERKKEGEKEKGRGKRHRWRH